MTDQIKTIGIFGEGKMGTNIFYYLLEFDYSLVWVCSIEADIEKIRKTFSKKMKRFFDSGIIGEVKYNHLQENVIITQNINAITSCNLIIEAISENLDLKKKLFDLIHPVAAPECILTSNSSSLNPSELIPAESRKMYFAGLHFFYPVSLKNITEIITTVSTSQDTINRVVEFLSQTGRNYLLLNEKCGFILNRIFLDFQNEAFFIVTVMKITFCQMDNLVKEHFTSSGVFEFCDHVGNEIMLASVKNYTADVPDKMAYQPFIDKLEELVRENRLGIKTGSGFYSYSDEKSPVGNSEEEIDSEKSLNIVDQLQNALKRSIRKFSILSNIPLFTLNNAMKEYLGSDMDFQ